MGICPLIHERKFKNCSERISVVVVQIDIITNEAEQSPQKLINKYEHVFELSENFNIHKILMHHTSQQ